MRRHVIASAGTVLLAGALLAGCGNDDPDDVAAEPKTGSEADTDAGNQPATQALDVTPELTADLAAMRAATASYVTDLDAARDAGYLPMTQLVAGTGYHLLNPAAPEEFDAGQPQLLVYSGDSAGAQLVAVGWAFTEAPAEPPLEGATFGDFPAACHYEDGAYVEELDEAACAESHPETGAQLTFWHPDLTTLHAWAWMPNPDGLFAHTNPLMSAYEAESEDEGEDEPEAEDPDQEQEAEDSDQEQEQEGEGTEGD
jgi:hypothetical protein